MPERDQNQFAAMAAEIADRVDEARTVGEQLTFLPDADGQGGKVVPDEKRGPGRPSGSKNKTDSALRAWLAHNGYRMPEDQLVRIAGLASSDDVLIQAMAETEQVLAWATGSANRGGDALGKRLETFFRIYTSKIRALEALLPYGMVKATPDVQVNQAVQVVVPQVQPMPGAPRMASDFAPPPMPGETLQNQQVIDAPPAQSDDESRTE